MTRAESRLNAYYVYGGIKESMDGDYHDCGVVVAKSPGQARSLFARQDATRVFLKLKAYKFDSFNAGLAEVKPPWHKLWSSRRLATLAIRIAKAGEHNA